MWGMGSTEGDSADSLLTFHSLYELISNDFIIHISLAPGFPAVAGPPAPCKVPCP